MITNMLEDRASWEAAYKTGWLDHYLSTGEIDWTLYNRPRNETTPEGAPVTLAESRLMLISSAGGYLPDSQQPFDAAHDLGDYSIRRLPADTLPPDIDFAHDHYDQTAVREDSQVLLPLAHLRALVAEGRLGALTPSLVSFMGYQPDVSRVLDETFPAIRAVAEQEHPDAILLVPS